MTGILNTIGCKEFTAISTDFKADAPGSPESQDYNPLKPDMIVVPTAQKAKKVPMSRSKSRKVSSASENDVFSVAAAPTPSTGPQNTLPLRNSAQPGATSAIFTLPALPDVPTLLSANTTETSKARMAWASAEVVLQVKNSEDSFPFFRNRNDEFSRAESRVQSRGQLAEYALEVFRHQHRLFLFAIAIGGSTAAFVRFDRRGAVVSGIFNYIDDPQPLGEFFYRLFRSGQDGMSLPRELRGHDPTAEPACESCTALFRGLHETRKESLDTVEVAGLKKAATKGWPIYCLMIESPWAADGRAVQPNDAVETHRILVGRPLFSSPYMMGRGTRGFVGWDIDADRQVFVKDSWRAESSRLCSEMDVYYELWRDETSHDVKETHIPTILAGGNVRDVKNGGSVQSTCTQDLVRLTVPETPRVHSRIVMKEIGRRLKDFEHPFELANGIYGALLGTISSF